MPLTICRPTICASRKKWFVYTYEWLPEYVDFFISSIDNIPILKKYVIEYILLPCIKCDGITEEDKILRFCQDKILGFQYDFLTRLKYTGKEKHKIKATKILEKITKYKSVETVINNCP